MRNVFALFLLFTSLKGFSQALPGSGNSLQFNGAGQYIEIPDADGKNDFNTTENFTVECWVKVNPVQTDVVNNDNCIVEKWISSFTGPYSYVIRYYNQTGGNNTGKVLAGRYDGNIGAYVTSATLINDNKWHHVAFIRSGGTEGILTLYIDGVFQDSTVDKTVSTTLSNSPLFIARRGGTTQNYFKGEVDEVRIWNISLTEKEIRERMCRKITSSEALYANLTAYYKFDETSGTSLIDSRNSINGTLYNSPARLASGAAIGNTSAYTYGGSSVKLRISDSENIKVDRITGSPSGVQLYKVNNAPSIRKGIKGLGPNKTYFGVFPFGDSLIKYRVTYTYTNDPYVIQANEDSLKLYSRTSNSDDTWVNSFAKLDTTKNTLTTNDDNTEEYILGSSGVPLQIPKAASINDTIVKEGNSGTKTLKIPIRLNDAAIFSSSVSYTTEDSTAQAGQDYTSKSGVLNFAVGQLTDTIRVSIKGDAIVEPNEVFKISLSNPVNISIEDSIALVKITNDDGVNFSVFKAEGKNNLSASKSFFSVTPNPTKDYINIVSSKNITNAQVRVADMNGKTLFATKQNLVAGQQLKVSLVKFSGKFLFVTIVSNDNNEQIKIIKE